MTDLKSGPVRFKGKQKKKGKEGNILAATWRHVKEWTFWSERLPFQNTPKSSRFLSVILLHYQNMQFPPPSIIPHIPGLNLKPGSLYAIQLKSHMQINLCWSAARETSSQIHDQTMKSPLFVCCVHILVCFREVIILQVHKIFISKISEIFLQRCTFFPPVYSQNLIQKSEDRWKACWGILVSSGGDHWWCKIIDVAAMAS